MPESTGIQQSMREMTYEETNMTRRRSDMKQRFPHTLYLSQKTEIDRNSFRHMCTERHVGVQIKAETFDTTKGRQITASKTNGTKALSIILLQI